MASIFAADFVTAIAGALTGGAAKVVGAATTATATGLAALAAPASDMAERELGSQGVSFSRLKTEARKPMAQTGQPTCSAARSRPRPPKRQAKPLLQQREAGPSDGEFDSILQCTLKAGKDKASQAAVRVAWSRSLLFADRAQPSDRHTDVCDTLNSLQMSSKGVTSLSEQLGLLLQGPTRRADRRRNVDFLECR